jgi:hypothetical protein
MKLSAVTKANVIRNLRKMKYYFQINGWHQGAYADYRKQMEISGIDPSLMPNACAYLLNVKGIKAKDYTCPACLLGGYYIVTKQEDFNIILPTHNEPLEIKAITTVLTSRGRSYNIPAWNDEQGRTLIDVLILIDDAVDLVQADRLPG